MVLNPKTLGNAAMGNGNIFNHSMHSFINRKFINYLNSVLFIKTLNESINCNKIIIKRKCKGKNKFIVDIQNL